MKWIIEFSPEHLSVTGRFKTVESDMIRMGGVTGDMWFCDEKDKMPSGDYIPKLIIAKRTYLSVERVEEVDLPDKINEIEVTETKTVKWI